MAKRSQAQIILANLWREVREAEKAGGFVQTITLPHAEYRRIWEHYGSEEMHRAHMTFRWQERRRGPLRYVHVLDQAHFPARGGCHG